MGILSGVAGAMSAEAQGQAQAKADDFKAQQDIDQFMFGNIKAENLSQEMTQKLTDSLANITAVRASTGTESGSPTGEAILARTQGLAEQDISRTGTNIDLQNQEYLKAYQFHLQAASDAKSAADTAALGSIIGGIGSMVGQISGLGG